MAVLLHQPLGVIAGDKVAHGGADLLDILEYPAIDHLRLHRLKEALDDTVRFGLADEGVARGQTPGLGLFLEVIGNEARPVVVTQLDATRGILLPR